MSVELPKDRIQAHKKLLRTVNVARNAAIRGRADYSQVQLNESSSFEYIGRELTGPQVVIGRHTKAWPHHEHKRQDITSLTARDTAMLPDGSFVRSLAVLRWPTDRPSKIISSIVNIDLSPGDIRTNDDQYYAFEEDPVLARSMITIAVRQIIIASRTVAPLKTIASTAR